jgi:hypothetical protein
MLDKSVVRAVSMNAPKRETVAVRREVPAPVSAGAGWPS